MMRLLAALLAFAWVCAARAQITVKDDTGQAVTIARSATRILSLSPHATELLYAAGAGERIVATVEYANYPEAAKLLPRVGSYSAFDLERIAGLKPDLAIVWGSGNPAGQVAQLRRLGIPLFISEPRRLDDVPGSLRRLGRLAGSNAEPAALAFEARLAGLRRVYEQNRPVTVFYEIWNQPLMTVGGDHVISDVIRLCGGRNVFSDLQHPAAAVDQEAVLRLDPEAIVASGMDEARPEWLDQWRRWPQLQSVKRGNLFFVPPDLIQRHTPRLLDGAELLCKALDTARNRNTP